MWLFTTEFYGEPAATERWCPRFGSGFWKVWTGVQDRGAGTVKAIVDTASSLFSGPTPVTSLESTKPEEGSHQLAKGATGTHWTGVAVAGSSALSTSCSALGS